MSNSASITADAATSTKTTTSIEATTSTEKLLSACGGALVTSLMVTPMDVVKMRLQTQQAYSSTTQQLSKAICCMTFNNCSLAIKHGLWNNRLLRSGNHFTNNLYDCGITTAVDPVITPKTPTNSHVFKGTLDGVYKIVKYEGVTALWKGLSPALVMSIPANVIYFVGYDYLRDLIHPFVSKLSKKNDYSPLFAGAFARTVAVTIISPIELFRTRLQANGGHEFKHVLEGVQKMVVQDGAKALWRGLPPTLWRDVPFSAIYWMGYEELKRGLENNKTQYHNMNELEISFLAGAISGMFAATITTPFDVAKTRRQVDAGKEHPLITDSRVPAILKQIYKQNGIRGLFRGLVPRVAKIGPSCAIMISSYEMGKTFFSRQ